MRLHRIVLAAILMLCASTPLAAQWIHLPAPGIPRTADGKPNLAAPAPKTADGKPDLSGVWTLCQDGIFFPASTVPLGKNR